MNTNINPDTPEKYSPEPHNGTQPQAHHASPVVSPLQPQREAFLVRTVSSLLHEVKAKAQSPITPLFDVFWLKGELAFLFGSVDVGKSILAVQIADAISRGAKIACFDGPQKPMKVGYFDFELSDSQFLKRYSDKSGNVYEFSPNFLRAEIDAKAEIPKGIDYILERIENTIIHNRIEVAVIDNLTALVSNINKTKYIMGFMRKLLLLKSRQNISMLVTCPYLIRDLCLLITICDNDSRFCDSAFSIENSAKGRHLRYLKQIKTRSAELKYDKNVAVFYLVKRNRFIGFEHIGFDDEREHLCNFF